MADFLLELFCEEIPARLQAKAAGDLERLLVGKLEEAGLKGGSAESFYGPRRLTLSITGLPEASPDSREERKGPKVGAPEKAVQGFLRGAGLTDISQAEVLETKKGEVYVAIIETKGRPAGEVIAEALADVVQNFPWPKSQRWGSGDLRWVRPLRRVLLTLDGEVVPFAIENEGQGVKASDETETHRVLGSGVVSARDLASYEKALTVGHVILRAEERRRRIEEGAAKLCADEGLELVEDEGLLREVTGLSEWPTAYMGRFDEAFLQLPDEVITAAMRGHQKYFSVRDPKTGRLAPSFVCVADIEGDERMMRGYERVLTARLSDALFLYRNDLSKRLESHAEKLSGVTFFEGLGTIADKVERVAALARELAPACGADPDEAERAARLAKADLASEMVYEFPELQGLMGRYYALEQGESEAVADAIRDHYKPQGQSDDLPTNKIGVAVSLADKLDTLAAFWSIDQKPTGSRDPFALRRAALAVIRMILAFEIRRSTNDMLLRASSKAKLIQFEHLKRTVRRRNEKAQYAAERERLGSSATRDEVLASFLRTQANLAVSALEMTEDEAEQQFTDEQLRLREEAVSEAVEQAIPIATDLLTFFHDRLTVYFRDQGFRHDRVAAALEEGADDFVLVEKKLRALSDFLDTPEGADLSAAYKRAANILKAEEKKTGLPDADPDPSLFEQEEERALHAALETAETKAQSAIAEEDFASAMAALSAVRGPLDAFFEAVTVNAEDEGLRANRLAQLLRLKTTVQKVADFDRLEG
ncbi:glycine--tRNA ligase subunit beta [Parvularcula maris]|uniref:Glycine--tRNA ligase beta subunit n=1 Tax=Parvularcula maris TaxID=2965077 RepID=A0A9X2RHV8_9PROT|nr:glycine--tRNA ligase subunit beta [Parvularcula maris]MCQ8185294.1 glycine--tRNA ligase subunit beta [Parvularcula maris]